MPCRRTDVLFHFQHVTEAAYGANDNTGAGDLEADARHVHFDGVGRDFFAPRHDGIEDLLFRHDAGGVLHQVFQQRPFAY